MKTEYEYTIIISRKIRRTIWLATLSGLFLYTAKTADSDFSKQKSKYGQAVAFATLRIARLRRVYFMATINYQFSDGHYEEIEVTEDFKREYELLERQDLRRYWKIKQQKYRAGIGCKYDLSLDTRFL